MSNIDIKLKSYDELQFEVMTLTTNNYLKDLKIKDLKEEVEYQDLWRREYRERIDKAVEYINKYYKIEAYYEYIDEDGYDEYNSDEDFKEELLDILRGNKDE